MHLGEYDGATIGVGQHNEPAPRRFLCRPDHRQPAADSLSLRCVRIVDGEPHRRAADAHAGGKDAALVMPTIIAVQHDARRSGADDRDDLISKHEGQFERVGVKRLGLGEVRDKRITLSKCSVRTEPPGAGDNTRNYPVAL
jgi:hypothetical protein